MALIFMLAEHEPPEFRLLNGPDSNGPVEEPETEEIFLKRTRGPLGLSIVGGVDHSSHPFGGDEPGIFISKVRMRSCCGSVDKTTDSQS